MSISKSIAPRRRFNLQVLLLVFPTCMLTACLSLTGMDQNSVLIETEPAGALATSLSGERCTTPCSMRIRKIAGQVIRLEKPGLEPAEVRVESRITPGGVARLIGGNAIAAVVVAYGVGSLFPSGTTITDALLFSLGTLIGASSAVAVDLKAGAHRTWTSKSLRVTLEPLSAQGDEQANDPAPHYSVTLRGYSLENRSFESPGSTPCGNSHESR
ncbi:MAG: hypothetical protein LC732_06480 [Acidobacteria bacterium]|nr:hypothetical protein [Acidobacteriota bacterium]